MLVKFKKIFQDGGENRQKYTVPPLVFQFFKFIYKLDHAVSQQGPDYEFQEGEEHIELPDIDLQKAFYQVQELLSLIQTSYPELCLRLFMQAAQVINNIRNNGPLEELSYDFISTALLVYQDELSDSEQKMAAIKLITATIASLTHFDNENYDTLSTNAAQYCYKLLKKKTSPRPSPSGSACSPTRATPTPSNSPRASRRTSRSSRYA